MKIKFCDSEKHTNDKEQKNFTLDFKILKFSFKVHLTPKFAEEGLIKSLLKS